MRALIGRARTHPCSHGNASPFASEIQGKLEWENNVYVQM